MTRVSMIERGQEWIEMAQKYEELNQKIKFLTAEKSKTFQQLQKLSEYKDSFGGEYEFKCHDRIGTINYKLIPELKNIDLSPYRGDSISCWKLTYKKKFEDIL